MSIKPSWSWSESYYNHLKARLDRMKLIAPTLPSFDDKQHIIFLDVQSFQPCDLQVSLVDGYIYVRGSHPERQDNHGWVERSFKRKIKLPDNMTPDSVESHLSADGILTIRVESKGAKGQERTYHVPIFVEPKC